MLTRQGVSPPHVANFLPLAVPALWIILLAVAMLIAGRTGLPSNVLTLAMKLVAAWVLIRFATGLLPSPTASRIAAVVAWTAAALAILGLLIPTIEVLRAVSLHVGESRLTLLALIEAILTLGVLLWATAIFARVFEHRIQKLGELTPTARVLFGKLLRIALITLAFLVSLGIVGIDLTALAVFTGAIGVGVGFGLQKSVANLFAGIVLLLDKSIKPGDIIQVGDTYGWVNALGARYVEVETRDGTQFLIPNEDIITQQVFNWTHQDENVRLKLPVRIAYDNDVRLALRLMREAAQRRPRVLKEPLPNPLVIRFGDNGIDLELRFWIADVRNGIHNISSEVLLEIIDLFREHGIAMPFPQRHVRILPPPEGEVRSSLPG